MARYKLTKEHYLQDKKAKIEPQAYEKGAEVDWPGEPSLHMVGLDKEGRERVKQRTEAFGESKRKAQERRATLGWSPTYAQNMARIIERPEPGADAPAQSTSGSGARVRKAA
jgi:hypothetical protein